MSCADAIRVAKSIRRCPLPPCRHCTGRTATGNASHAPCRRAGAGSERLAAIVERDEAEAVLAESGRQTQHGQASQDGSAKLRAAGPQWVDSEASAATMTVALLSCSNWRVISGLKFVSDDCAQSIVDTASPGSQSLRPTRLKPVPVLTLA